MLAAWVAPRLSRARSARQWGQRAAGSAFIGLGLLTAISGRR
jgi:threonine/homoserine/homoserine lactone efflux protein